MAGPLGEMFDHGCDALNTTLEAILACRALNLGRSWWTVASQIATLANFYLSTWEEYHTGVKSCQTTRCLFNSHTYTVCTKQASFSWATSQGQLRASS